MTAAVPTHIAIDAESARFLCDLAKSKSPFRINAITPALSQIARGKGEFLVLNLARTLINHLDAAGELSFGLDGWSARDPIAKPAIQTSYQEFIVDTVIALSKAEGPDRALDARIHAALDLFGEGGNAPAYTADEDLCWETAKRINPTIHAGGLMDGNRFIEHYDGAATGIPPAHPNDTHIPFETTHRISAATEPLAGAIALLMLLYVQVSADLRAHLESDDVPLQPDYANLSPQGWEARQARLDRVAASLAEKGIEFPAEEIF